jgi:hypothetical protein
MLLSKVRAILPTSLGRFGKPVLVVGFLVVLFAMGKDTILGWMPGSQPAAQVAPAAEAVAVKQAPKPMAPVHHAGRISAEFDTPVAPAAPIALVEQPGPEPQEEAPAPAEDGRARKAVKSVGHFLHIGHRKPKDE